MNQINTKGSEKRCSIFRLRLKAGFSHVAVVSMNRPSLQLIEEAY